MEALWGAGMAALSTPTGRSMEACMGSHCHWNGRLPGVVCSWGIPWPTVLGANLAFNRAWGGMARPLEPDGAQPVACYWPRRRGAALHSTKHGTEWQAPWNLMGHSTGYPMGHGAGGYGGIPPSMWNGRAPGTRWSPACGIPLDVGPLYSVILVGPDPTAYGVHNARVVLAAL